MMRILFYSYAYPNPLQPALGTFNRTMVKSLAAGHDVSVVSPVSFIDVWKNRLCGRSLQDPAFVAVPGVSATYVPFYYPPRVMRDRFDQFQDWTAGRVLSRQLKSLRPDVVLSYWTHPDGAVAVRAAHRAGIPAAVFVGGSDVLILGRTGARRQAILKVLHEADAVLTVSEHLSRTMHCDGIDPDKIHVIRRGVDRSIFSAGDRSFARRQISARIPAVDSNDSRPWIVAAGRLAPVKDFPNLIASVGQLKQQGIDVRCDILGDGPLKSSLQGLIETSGLADRVFLQGGQSQVELAQWYRACDVLTLSSTSEGVPNVLLEGMTCGARIVATQVGGIPEITDLAFDRLVPPSDPTALAFALSDVLRSPISFDPDQRQSLPLSLEDSAAQIASVLRSACGFSRERSNSNRCVTAPEAGLLAAGSHQQTRIEG